MQGQTILANVVIKSTVQVEKVANLQTYLYPDGFFGPLLEFQASRREGSTRSRARRWPRSTAPTRPSTAERG